ncbi:hypothetical protein EJ08DRAFT_735539 [Tothia fuscella]|uniref:Uncharacterized protein n=1 Tax=Tothia fuscella TaxID=1048955 RepID=A0A9P4NNK3_9PEZI|nr:hypothetical protein EJ08DRAFT_735539 [Tothia fuscella]
MATSVRPHKTSFFDLARELRDQIYRFALEGMPRPEGAQSVNAPISHNPREAKPPNVAPNNFPLDAQISCPAHFNYIAANLTVNKQYYAEVSYVFYHEIYPKLHFVFTSPGIFNAFMRTVGIQHENFTGKLHLMWYVNNETERNRADYDAIHLTMVFIYARFDTKTESYGEFLLESTMHGNRVGEFFSPAVLDEAPRFAVQRMDRRISLKYLRCTDREAIAGGGLLLVEGELGVLGQIQSKWHEEIWKNGR